MLNLLSCFADWCIRLVRPKRTNGFATAFRLTGHFGDHGADFGAVSAQHYELLADRFLVGCLKHHVLECFRASNGDKLRYNTKSEEFGILNRANTIKTYYVPDPLIHGEPTNLDYFRRECAK